MRSRLQPGPSRPRLSPAFAAHVTLLRALSAHCPEAVLPRASVRGDRLDCVLEGLFVTIFSFLVGWLVAFVELGLECRLLAAA